MDKTPRKRRRGRKANEKLNATNNDNEHSREEVETADIVPVHGGIALSKEAHREVTDDTYNVTKSDKTKSSSDIPTIEKRQRGKKRKGRKGTSDIVNTVDKENEEQTNSIENEPKTVSNETTEDGPATKKRRCIGRKPVTDFIVGQTYNGKVVYIKPFGLFLDIGCHSDAFCHVSRVSDNFVESIESMFQIGDDITNARIIDVNRKAKRITVSLQSENRINDEMTSMKSWKERMDKRESKKLNEKDSKKTSSAKNIPKPDQPNYKTNPNNPTTRANAHKSDALNNNANNAIDTTNESYHKGVENTINESTTSVDPKRARKIARRAERREKAATIEIATDKKAQ